MDRANNSRYRKPAFSLVIISIFFIVISVLIGVSSVEAQEKCIFERLTNDPEETSRNPVLSPDGSCVVFESSSNLTGQNPNNNFQIFHYDIESKKLTQITPGNIDGQNDTADVNNDCSKIAFLSTADITGGNSNNENQLLLFDVNTSTFQQLTNIDDGKNIFSPSIDGAGGIITFQSDSDINGGNGDLSSEIYFVTPANGIITQVTDSLENSRDPFINLNGTIIGFESSADINGTNPNKNQEIYTFNIGSSTFIPITMEDNGNSFDPSLNSTGTIISFESTSNINGGNPGNAREIYFYDTGVITQVTFTGLENQNPFVNANGNIIVFQSPANLTGQNPLGIQQLFTFNIADDTFEQITNLTTGFNQNPKLDATGELLTFSSTGNILPNTTNDELQVYLYRCLPVAIPTLSQWGMFAAAVILGMAGLLAVRRKSTA